jgi:formylglycine-generating enzyme required for sulfatase activity
MLFFGCSDLINTDEDDDNEKEEKTGYFDESYEYTKSYNMITVPVPAGGIVFPSGYNDDSTANVTNAYSIGETEIPFGLWQTVALWAVKNKGYNFLYYKKHGYLLSDQVEYPICGVTWVQALIWCNAYTEWYNEKNGTNLTPVYTDSQGVPLRNPMTPLAPDFMGEKHIDVGEMVNNQGGNDGFWVETRRPNVARCWAIYREYTENNSGIVPYLNNTAVTGTGFRLPTAQEFELSSRWNGSNTVNTVSGIIDDVDFTEYPIKFTKGNSASGAGSWIGNLKETNNYAVFEYYSKDEQVSKTKLPNFLGLYDMSGNLREYVYNVAYINVITGDDGQKEPWPFSQTRGGYFEDIYDALAVGGSVFVDVFAYNYYYGFRVARDSEP